MKLITHVTLGDHFRDILKRTYSSVFNLGMPAAILGFNLLNPSYRDQLLESGIPGFVIAYLLLWAAVNAIMVTMFMVMSLWGPLRNSRGTYEVALEGGNIVERGPTNTRMIEVSMITAVKTDFKDGAVFTLKNGKTDGIFFRGNSPAAIKQFMDAIEERRKDIPPPVST